MGGEQETLFQNVKWTTLRVSKEIIKYEYALYLLLFPIRSKEIKLMGREALLNRFCSTIPDPCEEENQAS